MQEVLIDAFKRSLNFKCCFYAGKNYRFKLRSINLITCQCGKKQSPGLV